MSKKLGAGHDRFGNGEGDEPVRVGIGPAGESAGEHPMGIHIIKCRAGKPVCDKLAFIQRVKDYWKNAEGLEKRHGARLVCD